MSSGGSSSDSSASEDSSPASSAINGLYGLSNDFKIFTDADTPFTKAPAGIQQLLLKAKDSNGSLVCGRIDLAGLDFQPKPTDNHRCMHLFDRNSEVYYHCKECTGASWETERVIFCKDCFVPDDHLGHHYYQEICRSRECFCDCGSLEKTSSSFKCKRHGEDRVIIRDIDKDQRTRFITTFVSLLQVAFYTENKGSFLDDLCEKLTKLCEGSAYYCEMVLEIIKKQAAYSKQSTEDPLSKLFLVLLNDNAEIGLILQYICANNDLQMELARFLVSFFKEPNSLQNVATLQDFTIGLIFQKRVVMKLADENMFVLSLTRIYVKFIQEKDQKSVQLFVKFLKFLSDYKELQPGFLEQQMNNQSAIVCPDIAWPYLKIFVDNYPSLEKPRLQQKKSKNKGKQRERQSIEWKNKLMNEVIMRSIVVIGKGDHREIQNVRSKFAEHGVDQTKFEKILQEITYFVEDFFFQKQQNFGNQTPLSMSTLLLLISKAPKCDQLINLLWLSLIGDHKRFEHLTANIFEITSAVLWSQDHFAMSQGAIQSLNPQSTANEEREKKISEFFNRFLALKQIIPKGELIEMRKSKLLQSSQVGKLLRTKCSYNAEDQAFFYNSVMPEPMFKDKFAFFLKETHVENMSALMQSNTNVFYSFELNLSIEGYQKEILNMLMKSKVLEEIVEEGWTQCRKNREAKLKEGFLYLFVLVFIDGFVEGKQKTSFNKKIEKMRNQFQQKNMGPYSKSESETLLIRRLLKIEQVEQPKINPEQQNISLQTSQPGNKEKQKQKEEGQKQEQQRKQKFDQKKRRLEQRYSQKRNAILQQLQSRSIDGFSDEQMCLTCRERSQPGNELVYLGYITVNNSLCRAMNGDNDKGNVRMFTCFHTLHLGCFVTAHRNGRNGNFMCPLCNSSVNCFFMRDLLTANQGTKLVFSNVIISNMLTNYKIYDTDNYFMLFFKHFLQSRGLKALAGSTENWQRLKIADKSDQFLESFMMQIYDSADDRQKKEFEKNIAHLLADIDTCENAAAKFVQLVIADALKGKLINGPNANINHSYLQALHSLVKNDEFLIIKQEAEEIIGEKIQFQSGEPQKSEDEKVSLTFSLHQIPLSSQCFESFILSHPCQRNHNKKMDFFCLICGRGICEECNDANDSLDHNGISAYLSIEDFVVRFKKENLDLEGEVYFNDFKVAYHEREDYDMVREVYLLNGIELSSLTQQFMQE